MLLVSLVAVQPAFSQTPLRIGMMGDSTTDEYRGTDNRGGSYRSVTFNWMEQIVMRRNAYAGAWGSRSEPRRTGYEYNWARSAATTSSLIQQGQHTALAQQVNARLVDAVFINVGNHDFAPYNTSNGYAAVYNGTLSGSALTQKINSMVSNITLAVDTVRAQRAIPVVVTTLPDWNLSPLILNNPSYSDPTKRQRVTNAINQVNNGIRTMAAARGLAVFDSSAFINLLLSRAVNGVLTVGGVQITMFSTGDEPHNGILGDKIHGGTVLEGLIASEYLRLLNTIIEPDIPPLTEQEILASAGLAATPPAPTAPPVLPTSTPTATPSATPPPPSNRVPVAVADSYSGQRNRSLSINFSSLLGNDSDPDNDPLSVTGNSSASRGFLWRTSSGLTYMPPLYFTGTVTFTYTIGDGRGGSDTETVTININR